MASIDDLHHVFGLNVSSDGGGVFTAEGTLPTLPAPGDLCHLGLDLRHQV